VAQTKNRNAGAIGFVFSIIGVVLVTAIGAILFLLGVLLEALWIALLLIILYAIFAMIGVLPPQHIVPIIPYV